jgi:uncharacterized protein
VKRALTLRHRTWGAGMSVSFDHIALQARDDEASARFFGSVHRGARELQMSASENKKVMENVMDALARGDGRPFADAMAEDFAWTFPGGGIWSGTWKGKERVRTELLGPLFAQFEGLYTNRAIRLVAEGDIVVVECRGQVRTKGGHEYNNTYCYVCRFEGGKLKELTEYMDTALAERVLAPPARPADE